MVAIELLDGPPDPKFADFELERRALLLWHRVARFGQLRRRAEQLAELLEIERQCIADLGAQRPAEEILEALRADPGFVALEQHEGVRWLGPVAPQALQP